MTGSLRIVYVGFCVTIAFAIWLLAYGIALQFIYGDARILQATVAANPLAPFQQFLAYSDSGVLRSTALAAFLPSVLVAGIVAYAGLRSNSSPLGDAQFQSVMSLRRNEWFRKKGKILGCFGRRILRVEDDRHHLIIGPDAFGQGGLLCGPERAHPRRLDDSHRPQG